MRVRRRVVAMALAIVAGGSIGPTPIGMAGSTGCPAPPLTVGELRSLWGGEYAGFAGMTSPRGRACFGGSDVRVIGFVDMPDGLGGTSASGIKPAWLTESGVWLYGASDAIAVGRANDSYTIASPPRFGDLNVRYARRWVAVTAHFDDPRARRCRGWGVEPPTKTESVRVCRSIMVLSSISTTTAPDTATLLGSPSAPDDQPGLLLAVAGLVGALAWVRRSRAKRGDSMESKRPGR